MKKVTLGLMSCVLGLTLVGMDCGGVSTKKKAEAEPTPTTTTKKEPAATTLGQEIPTEACVATDKISTILNKFCGDQIKGTTETGEPKNIINCQKPKIGRANVCKYKVLGAMRICRVITAFDPPDGVPLDAATNEAIVNKCEEKPVAKGTCSSIEVDGVKGLCKKK